MDLRSNPASQTQFAGVLLAECPDRLRIRLLRGEPGKGLAKRGDRHSDAAPRLQKLGIAAAPRTGARKRCFAKGFSNFAFGNLQDPYDACG